MSDQPSKVDPYRPDVPDFDQLPAEDQQRLRHEKKVVTYAKYYGASDEAVLAWMSAARPQYASAGTTYNSTVLGQILAQDSLKRLNAELGGGVGRASSSKPALPKPTSWEDTPSTDAPAKTEQKKLWSCGHTRDASAFCPVCAVFGRRVEG